MSNPRGEYTIQLGKEQYHISFSINALCKLEEITGKGIGEIGRMLSDTNKLTLTFIRDFLWAGLQKYHKDISVEMAGDLIDQYGLDLITDRLMVGFAEAFPSNDPNDRPIQERKAQVDGNGINSSHIGPN